MLKFKLTIAYDGAAYQGWQSQPDGSGVQNRIEAALARIFSTPLPLESSSRTDAGVHAFGMVAHFTIPRPLLRMPPRHLLLSLNACLPDDIRIRSAVRVPLAFHARFDAAGKQYRYTLWNHPAMHPLLRRHAWHFPHPLDLAAMRAAASHLIGRHDFRSFTANRGYPLDDAVRTLTRCDIRRHGHRWTIILEGDGFLYKMCRAIVGTLAHTGAGRLSSDTIPSILAAGDRRRAGMNAPAHGLVLHKVFYPRGRAKGAEP